MARRAHAVERLCGEGCRADGSAAGGYGETTIVPFIHGWIEQ